MEILISLIVVIIAATVFFLIVYFNSLKKKNASKISFRESMDLVELPIVTFYCGKNKLNFLLDTGSNDSFINKKALDGLEYKKLTNTGEAYGMEGNVVPVSLCRMNIYYRENKFEELFCINDLSQAFSNIKNETGVTIHGILGSKFFEKYKYVLDFKNLIAYLK